MSLPFQPTLLEPEPGPATLKTRPWGGFRLAALRDPSATVARPIGESWEFSTMPDSESRTGGRTLSAALGRRLPFLAKLLDTAHELSIQVHPDDDAVPGRIGKEEAWVVLAADPGARVLAGLRPGVDRDTFVAAAERVLVDRRDGWELVDLMANIPVRTGSVVLVPAGTVHAVGGGILLAEIQQPADCTLRLFDYGSDRELHVREALHAARPELRPTIWHHGEPPTRMAGRHLQLDVLAPGVHVRSADHDLLIVTFGGSCSVRTEQGLCDLPAGALRLATPGLTFELHVPEGSGAVFGSIR